MESGYGLYVPAGAFWGGEDVKKMADRNSLKVTFFCLLCFHYMIQGRKGTSINKKKYFKMISNICVQGVLMVSIVIFLMPNFSLDFLL